MGKEGQHETSLMRCVLYICVHLCMSIFVGVSAFMAVAGHVAGEPVIEESCGRCPALLLPWELL